MSYTSRREGRVQHYAHVPTGREEFNTMVWGSPKGGSWWLLSSVISFYVGGLAWLVYTYF